MIRVPGCSSGRTSSICRPCSAIVSISCNAQPSRAAARPKAEAAGTTTISPGSRWRASVAPTPCWNGSPEASTQTARPRNASTGADVERNRPGPRRAADQRRGQRQVAGAAEHHLGPADMAPGGLAEACDAVLADPDHRQPFCV